MDLLELVSKLHSEVCGTAFRREVAAVRLKPVLPTLVLKPAQENDRDHRRLIERLSGWRLVTFFAVFALNLIALVLLGLCVLAPGPYWQAVFVSLLSSQVALLALSIGAFRFPISTKLLLIVVHWIACIAAIGQFSTFGFMSQVVIESLFVFVTQSIILCGVATLWGHRKTTQISFQIRDILALTFVISMILPSLDYFVISWKFNWNAHHFHLYRFGLTGFVNSLWSLAILSCFVDGVIPLRMSGQQRFARVSQSLVLFLAALCLESGLLFGTTDKSFLLLQRVVFACWFCVGAIPVIGLSADPAAKRWITPTEFYRRVRSNRQ